MFIDQGLCTFRFLEAHNIMFFTIFFKHVKFAAKNAVVTTEKGTTMPGEYGAQGKKELNTPLGGIDWVNDQIFESSQDFSFFKLVDHGWGPLNHSFINSS